MTPEESKALFERIKENQRVMNECKRHLFVLPDLPYELGMKLTCSVCGGTMRADLAYQYVKGYIAAGGNPEDVAPNWFKP